MNVTEFAERILFSHSLEEKLSAPDGVMEFDANLPAVIAGEPGRPHDLRFGKKGNTELPSRPDLVNDERRGELLHFFANHELLATELMALALVKFPDAPVAFRRGLFHTLLEEQRHTKWYLARMKECGIAFGDLPVSRYFWDAVAPMETPLDYVTRLSLTFEQANLDYSKHYAGIMREAGDPKTAAILEQIYKDEISHVGYGLKWFRKWKKDGESDWEQFNRSLVFPLSPSRAKGNGTGFNAEGRKRAGLDDDFIAELELFERSKGRSPDVFFFNPIAEEEIAAGGPVETRESVLDLAHDLEILVAFLAKREDIALMRELPTREHLARLKACGFVLPELAPLDEEGGIKRDSLLRKRRLHRLRPWGHSPATAALLSPLVDRLPETERVHPLWKDAWEELCSKPPVVGNDQATVRCTSREDAEAVVKPGRTWVAKAPLGASGRRNQRFSEFNEVSNWIEKTIAAQGAVVIEPWLDRVFDFSAQYEMEDDELRFLGFVRMENGRSGRFCAAEAGPKFLRPVDPEIARFLMEKEYGSATPRLGFYSDILPVELKEKLAAAGYRGPVGVDAFVHRQADGSLGLRRVVEINARYTMGRVAIELARRIDPSRTARLEFFAKEEGNAREKAPPEFSGGSGLLTAGTVCLNDPSQARRLLAVLRAG